LLEPKFYSCELGQLRMHIKGYSIINKSHFYAASFLVAFLVVLISYCILPAGEPKIVFPKGKVFDFGVVDEGKLVKHSFVFENRGSRNLQIKNVKAGCGCTSTESEKFILPPGEHSKIDVSYKARPVQHREVLKVWVISNDPKKPVSELTMTGKVHLKVFWYPNSVSFYCKNCSNDQHKKVRFLTDSVEKLKVEDIRTSSERIIASWEKHDKGIECKISLTPNCPKGHWTERVTLQTIVGDYKRSIEIPVYLMIH